MRLHPYIWSLLSLLALATREVAAMLELSIKQGLARLKKLDIGQVQHLCQGCRNPTPPKRGGELILASDEQTFFCDLL
ncbi:hypothetical protein EMIT0196P_50053 [Pseudomonas chlororaphis]